MQATSFDNHNRQLYSPLSAIRVVPIADNNAFIRLTFAISGFEVVGVEGVLTCGVVGCFIITLFKCYRIQNASG